MRKPRIVCAALRAEDGDVLIGVRHYSPDMHKQISKRADGDKFKHRRGKDQGFVDQYGNYWDRESAMKAALAAGQCIDFKRNGHKHILFSEGLY